MDTLLQGDGGVDIDAARGQVTPDSVVKILMTSGSTSAPKGDDHTAYDVRDQTQISVIAVFDRTSTQRCGLAAMNHVFGGSHNFNDAGQWWHLLH